MSWPTVSWRPAIAATFSLVPTPSVEATRMVSAPGLWKRPPKLPMPPITPGVTVFLTICLMVSMPPIFLSMSTPAAAYALCFASMSLGLS